MTISTIDLKKEYKLAFGNVGEFTKITGMSPDEFTHVLASFKLKNPGKLSAELKLFAALYFNKYSIDTSCVGKSLEYKGNWPKSGKAFMEQAEVSLIPVNKALAQLRKAKLKHSVLKIKQEALKLEHAILQIKQEVPKLERAVLRIKAEEPKRQEAFEIINLADVELEVTKDGRKKSSCEDNRTISISCSSKRDADTLNPAMIEEHAARRVDLFFYLLVAYYKTGLTVSSDKTNQQHGKGSNEKNTNACHSSILPAVWDSEVLKQEHNHGTRANFKPLKVRTGILEGTSLEEAQNSTVELSKAVNYFDSNWIEGKADNQSKMRSKSLSILNDVSKGALTPDAGLLAFLITLNTHFSDIKAGYFNKEALLTSPKESRELIFSSEKKGSFKGCFFESTRVNKASVNPEYLAMHLKMSAEDTDALQKVSDADADKLKSKVDDKYFMRLQREIKGTKLGFFAAEVKEEAVVGIAPSFSK